MIGSSLLTETLKPLVYACLATALVLTGCSTTTRISHSARGTVYLEEVTDWSFEASHPAVIDQITLLKIVKGLYSDESQTGLSRMSAGGTKPMRVFSDEDAEFLAPLLAQGLSKAKPEHIVWFRVSSSAGSGSEPTAGSIYVQNGAVHLTIAKGASNTTFVPEPAAHTENAPSFAAGGMSGVMSQVIDYHALAKAPMPGTMPMAESARKAAATPVAGATTASKGQVFSTASGFQGGERDLQAETDQLSKAKDAIAKKDSEINMLRKESAWMKRELRERDEELNALKASVKTPPKKKKAEAQPTR